MQKKILIKNIENTAYTIKIDLYSDPGNDIY